MIQKYNTLAYESGLYFLVGLSLTATIPLMIMFEVVPEGGGLVKEILLMFLAVILFGVLGVGTVKFLFPKPQQEDL